MTSRIAAFIVNYNMPERADALFEYLDSKSANVELDIYLIDNGSDLVKPPANTNVFVKENCQTTGGWLEGLKAVDESGEKYDLYMFLITSTEFVEASKGLVSTLASNFADKDVVGVHASLTSDSTTAWPHLKNYNLTDAREVWMIDNICSMYRADWFDRMGRFEKELIYAHGVDLEMSYFARRDGKKLLVDERVEVKKTTDIGYTMDRMNMTAKERNSKAYKNMCEVLEKKYGGDWWKKIVKSHIKPGTK